jgi:hypothetical protein
VANKGHNEEGSETEVARLRAKLDERAVDFMLQQHQLQAAERKLQQQAQLMCTDTKLKATWYVICRLAWVCFLHSMT